MVTTTIILTMVINTHKCITCSPLFRFCGRNRPLKTLESETNEMMVAFRTNYTAYWNAERRGFKARFVAGKSLLGDGARAVL